MARAGTKGVGSKVINLSEELKGWLGKDYKVITNKRGDNIFMSKDGLKKIRFDIKNPRPHDNPHSHIEVLENGKWKKIKWKGKAQLYPKDVPNH